MFIGTITNEVIAKWQSMVNLMAEVFGMPAGFIVCLNEKGFEVIIANQNEKNPYPSGVIIKHDVNIFCRKVVEECKPLAVFEATKMEEWETNPEIKDGFNTYIGFPILNEDGSPFGTICVMDFESHPVNDTYINLLDHFKAVAELDLKILHRLQDVTDLTLKDPLTNSYNRRGFETISHKQFYYGKRDKLELAFLIVDIDQLKCINDQYGHQIGDKAIVTVAEALTQSCRRSDLIARVGGDEFYVVLNLATPTDIENVIERAREYLNNNPIKCGVVTFSWGVSVMNCTTSNHLNIDQLIEEADKMLYEQKKAFCEAVAMEASSN